jgi:quinol monooxygenase YgiN
MKIGLVAFHYPHHDHHDEMIARVRRAAEVMAAQPGCLAADCWVSEDNEVVVTTGQWDSEEALASAFVAVYAAGVDFDFDEREICPRRVVKLVSP